MSILTYYVLVEERIVNISVTEMRSTKISYNNNNTINALVCRTLTQLALTQELLNTTQQKATVTMIEGGAQRTMLENYYSRRWVWPTSKTR